MTTKTEISNELTDAINDYGSEASRENLAGMGKEDWHGWLNHAERHGVEAAVKAIDDHYAEPKIVRVVYWVGTNQRTSEVSTYAEALEVASGNENAHDPKFYEIATGKQLFDDGNGLCDEDQSVYVC